MLPAASHCESAILLGVEPSHSDSLRVATVYAFFSFRHANSLFLVKHVTELFLIK